MPILLFDTTHHALWAESLALERGLGAQVVPAPEGSGALCAIALEVLPDDLAEAEAVLGAAGVEYRVQPRRSG